MHIQQRIQTARPAAALLVVTLLVSGCGTVEPEAYRGRLLRTVELERSERRSLRVEFDGVTDRQLVFAAHGSKRITVEEQNVHERVLVYAEDGEFDRDQVEYAPVRGQTMLGDVTRRVEEQDEGRLPNEKLGFDGREVTTDDTGRFRVPLESLLVRWDDPRQETLALEVRHRTRDIEELLLARDRVLAAMGIHFSTPAAPVAPRLHIQVDAPPVVKNGERFDVTVTVQNTGVDNAAAVEALLFSSTPWLNGKRFYFGDLPPNAKRMFQRQFTAPIRDSGGARFALVGFRHGGGSLKELQQRLELEVQRK